MHFVPVLTLTPATNFHPEVVMNSGKRISIGRKVTDEVSPDIKVFNSKVVSRMHAEIWFSGGQQFPLVIFLLPWWCGILLCCSFFSFFLQARS